MVNWMERARAEIWRSIVPDTREAVFQKSNGTNDSTTPLNFSLFLADSAPIFGEAQVRATAKTAVRTPDNGIAPRHQRIPEPPTQPAADSALRAPEPGLYSWRQRILDFEPQTAMGEKLREASITFLAGDLSARAAELGWGDLELFGAFRHADAAVVNRRPASKGLVVFTALAPWEGTRIAGIEATNATIVTGAGGTFRSIRRPVPDASPFWELGL